MKLQPEVYDESRVSSITAEVAQAIDAAMLGSGSWDDVPAALSGAFPGSWAAIWNMNFAENTLNFLRTHNMAPGFLQSYADHFASVNPWTPYWTSVRSGVVAVSEKVLPARSFARTEFYNDWLRPQKVEAAVGMKLVGDQRETVQFLMHFPVSMSERYESAAVDVLTRVRGNLERSVSFARLMRTGAEAAVAGAALVERSRCAALVVDPYRHVYEANQGAVELFSSGQCVAVKANRCFLADKDADARFGFALRALSGDIPVDGTRISFRTAAGAWQVALAALPGVPMPAPNPSLLPPHKMVLVLVTELHPGSGQVADLSALSAAFGLTPSEILFCRRLALGESVSDAADNLGITVETARTRLKSIFQKTGTSRQGQLMLLIARLT
jgi:DNA-binding CsgD family transcriptional regulator/PAS domain-containing protein